jgi:hypothetical protein
VVGKRKLVTKSGGEKKSKRQDTSIGKSRGGSVRPVLAGRSQSSKSAKKARRRLALPERSRRAQIIPFEYNFSTPAALVASLEHFVSMELPPLPMSRSVPFTVIGTADIGQLEWCPQKATFEQVRMEQAFANRALSVIASSSATPSFLKLDKAVHSIETAPPTVGRPAVLLDDPEIPAWQIVEEEETRQAWHVGFVARYLPMELSPDLPITVLLVGITDGVLPDGTVIEVRHSNWPWKTVVKFKVNSEKATQANIYSTLLGASRFRCVFRVSDGRQIEEGNPNPELSKSRIEAAVRARLGLVAPKGVPQWESWKCKNGRCDFAKECTVRPI